MAGRRGKLPPQDEALLRQAAADASRFLFAADMIPAHGVTGSPGAPPAPRPRLEAELGAAAPADFDRRQRSTLRDSLRERLQEAGPETLADPELLALLLFQIAPRRDARALAKALLARFGDFAAVLAAPEARLAETPGVGPSTALELKIIQAVVERTTQATVNRKPSLSSWSALMAYCKTWASHAEEAELKALFLDVKDNLIADKRLGEGEEEHAALYAQAVARQALELSAAAAILLRRHSPASPRPSPADIAIIRDVAVAAKAVGLVVHDYIVIGRDGVASLKAMHVL